MKHPIFNSKWVIDNIYLSTNKENDKSLIHQAIVSGFKKEELERH